MERARPIQWRQTPSSTVCATSRKARIFIEKWRLTQPAGKSNKLRAKRASRDRPKASAYLIWPLHDQSDARQRAVLSMTRSASRKTHSFTDHEPDGRPSRKSPLHFDNTKGWISSAVATVLTCNPGC